MAASRPRIGEAPTVHIVLRDGSTAEVRPVAESDAEALVAFLDGLSPQSRWFRFFTGAADLDRVGRWATATAERGGMGLLVTTGEQERIVAHAGFEPESPGRAEVAFAVADEMQGRGMATTLLAHLAQEAAERGIETFTALVLPENHAMIGVFRESGFPVEVRASSEGIQVELPTSLDEEGRRRFDERERFAAVAAVNAVLRPRSIAVLGASSDPESAGGAVFRKLLSGGFRGALHAVSDREPTVEGRTTHAAVSAIPGPVELAVVAVPAQRVAAAARECAAAGVRALVVLTGAVDRDELVEICRTAGMRLAGPQSLGVINTNPGIALDATFASATPVHGRVGFAAQSAGSGLAGLEAAAARGVGLSSFVSFGEKVDLSGNDMLQFWEEDWGTDVVLLSLESFGNPRRFGSLARRLASRKPVVVMKSGRAPASAAGERSGTRALLAASDTSVDALFAHAGVIRTDTMQEVFDVAALLAHQPLPSGGRVGIVTNARGPGLACSDACHEAGLEPAKPVSLPAMATPGAYREATEGLADAPDIDAVVTIHIHTLTPRAAAVAAALEAAGERASERGKPLLTVFVGGGGAPDEVGRPERRVPVYPAPEEAIRALGRAVRHAAWREAPHDPAPVPEGCEPDAGASIIAAALAKGGGWLDMTATLRLLSCWGLPLAESREASSAAEAGRAAATLGGAVAVKAVAPGMAHGAEAGGVRLDVVGARDAEKAAEEAAEAVRAIGHDPEGFIVQAMAPPGVEMTVGVLGDPRLGPLVACGTGGTVGALMGDVQVRLAPLAAGEAGEMVRALKGFPLLDGYRGAPRADVEALEDVVLRVAALAGAHPEVVDLDCDGVVVSPSGATVVDARIRVQASPRREPFPALDK
jgi:acetate---CoA ligase (ADP-forming)